MGRTWEYPPPAAPPFVPNTGPSEGSRIATIPFVPRRFRAWPSPTVVGLPLPVARRRDPRDEDELPLLPLARALDGLESDLRAVVSFQDEVVPGEPDVLRDVDDRPHPPGLRDLDVREHGLAGCERETNVATSGCPPRRRS